MRLTGAEPPCYDVHVSRKYIEFGIRGAFFMSSAAEDEHPVMKRERERCRKAVQAQ